MIDITALYAIDESGRLLLNTKYFLYDKETAEWSKRQYAKVYCLLNEASAHC
jgi:hypothetical protein